ncbi:MAG TPA: 30S ribosomal protein S4 [Chloroflexota bacterium]|nr:30S ribosomal protein S4 [Chloroflexota bacterium]
MARYTGPDCKLCRREGVKLFLKGDRCLSKKCAVEKRPSPPGQQMGGRRRKPSDFAIQLREKQKARRMYGVLEGQFKRTFDAAERLPGVTGDNLLRLLELRMDNVIYRLGFGSSRDQARQLVEHGHFLVNDRRASVPSMQMKTGDVITVRAGSKNREFFKNKAEFESARATVPQWLELDQETMTGRVVGPPSRADLETTINEQLIVEHYSR